MYDIINRLLKNCNEYIIIVTRCKNYKVTKYDLGNCFFKGNFLEVDVNEKDFLTDEIIIKRVYINVTKIVSIEVC